MNSSDYYTLYTELWYESNPKELVNLKESCNDFKDDNHNKSEKIYRYPVNYKIYNTPDNNIRITEHER